MVDAYLRSLKLYNVERFDIYHWVHLFNCLRFSGFEYSGWVDFVQKYGDDTVRDYLEDKMFKKWIDETFEIKTLV